MAITSKPRATSPRVSEYLGDRVNLMPVWVRAPKRGVEHFSGFSRTKLYKLAGENRIRSVSIREPGQIKGTRLFNLQSILSYVESCEARCA